jgi:glycosyltransferase involved in cell wall biosynthesis
MRILILTSFDHPLVRLEAEALSNLYKVRYVLVEQSKNPSQLIREGIPSFLRAFPMLFIALLRLRIPPMPLRTYLYMLLSAVSVINKIELRRSAYDVIYAHWLFPAGFIALLLSKIINCKVVSHIRGYDIQVMPGVSDYGIVGWKRVISKYVIRRADRVLAEHEVHAGIAIALAGANCKGKMLYIRPGIPELTEVDTGHAQLPTKIARKMDQTPNCKLVLYSPSLFPYYGIIELIKAIPFITAAATNTHFAIAGDGTLDQMALDIATREGVGDSITFLGRVDYNTMLELYRRSNVVCDLCYFGQGTTTIEAFCFGKPVIGIASPKRYIVNEENGFMIRRGDYRALASQVLKLLTDEDLAARMSRKARECFELNYTMDSRVNALAAVFDSVATLESQDLG